MYLGTKFEVVTLQSAHNLRRSSTKISCTGSALHLCGYSMSWRTLILAMRGLPQEVTSQNRRLSHRSYMMWPCRQLSYQQILSPIGYPSGISSQKNVLMYGIPKCWFTTQGWTIKTECWKDTHLKDTGEKRKKKNIFKISRLWWLLEYWEHHKSNIKH